MSDPEDSFISTNSITDEIIQLYMEVEDLEAAEVERRQQISEAEALGDTYRQQAATYKHLLVHLYNDKNWGQNSTLGQAPDVVPKQRVEQILLEATDTYRATFMEGAEYLYSLDDLRAHYETTGQLDKLKALLKNIEPILSISQPADIDTIRCSLALMKGVALSFSRFCEYDLAEWWLVYRQQQIEGSEDLGPTSHEALSNNLQLAKLFMDQKNSQAAQPYLTKAQQIATDLLPSGHELHRRIPKIMASGVWVRGNCCNNCLVNPHLGQRGFIKKTCSLSP
jgi:hypothetical protein